MDNSKLIEIACYANGVDAGQIRWFEDNKFLCQIDGYLNIDELLSDQGQLMYCKGGNFVKLVGVRNDCLVVEVGESR